MHAGAARALRGQFLAECLHCFVHPRLQLIESVFEGGHCRHADLSHRCTPSKRADYTSGFSLLCTSASTVTLGTLPDFSLRPLPSSRSSHPCTPAGCCHACSD